MRPLEAEHVVVYRNEREFAGWPFNGGFWQFEDGELALGFMTGPCDYSGENSCGHDIVDVSHVILRSRDGGKTWPKETLTTVYPDRLAFANRLKTMESRFSQADALDPRKDGFCVASGFGLVPDGAPHVAFAMVSTDRGRTWREPTRLPVAGLEPGAFRHLGSRPSTVVREDGMLLLFAHGSRNPSEDPSVPLVFGSWDGGLSWGLIAEVEPVPRRPMAIMPFPLILSDQTLLMAVRRQYDCHNAYTQVYASSDGGRTWGFLSRVNDWGAPANLVQLFDGRVVCVYGYRQKPFGIRAKVSHDLGRTWGPEIVIRADGGSWDLGYPRTLLLSDGRLITAYYFNSKDDLVQCDGGIRHIVVTRWRV